jgi:hypothetical protein
LRFPAKFEVPEDGVATECHPYMCFHTIAYAGGSDDRPS